VLKCSGCKSTVTCFHKGGDPFVTGHHSGCPFLALHATKKTKKPVRAATTTAAAAADENNLSLLGNY